MSQTTLERDKIGCIKSIDKIIAIRKAKAQKLAMQLSDENDEIIYFQRKRQEIIHGN